MAGRSTTGGVRRMKAAESRRRRAVTVPADRRRKAARAGSADKSLRVERFLRDLPDNERLTLDVCADLYKSWSNMIKDLKWRSKGDVFFFRLAHRIEEDLWIIDKLRAAERRLNVNLIAYVNKKQQQKKEGR
jgi:hypothetical protein